MKTSARSIAARTRWTAFGVALIGLWCAGLTDVQRSARPAGRPIAAARPAQTNPHVADSNTTIDTKPKHGHEPGREAARAIAPPTSSERTAEQVQAQRTELDGRFREEAADPAWATEYGQHLRNLLAAVGITGDAIRGLECKSTLCRLELAGAELPALTAIAGQLATQYWVRSTATSTLDILIARPTGSGI